jgi:hypothetical protein
VGRRDGFRTIVLSVGRIDLYRPNLHTLFEIRRSERAPMATGMRCRRQRHTKQCLLIARDEKVTMTSESQSNAVVLGASIGGLLAARALSEFYRTVTVVERDHLHDSAINRRGVPQGRHPHGLPGRGRKFSTTCFPACSMNSRPTAH